jgi:hypothetical protein
MGETAWLFFLYHTLAKSKLHQSLFLQSQTLSGTQRTKYHQPTPFNLYKNLLVLIYIDAT